MTVRKTYRCLPFTPPQRLLSDLEMYLFSIHFFFLLCLGFLLSTLWSAVLSHYKRHPRRMLLLQVPSLQLYSRPPLCYVKRYMKTGNSRGEPMKNLGTDYAALTKGNQMRKFTKINTLRSSFQFFLKK